MQVQVLVVVNVDDCDTFTYSATPRQAKDAAKEAVENAVKYGEATGFSHERADVLSITVASVDALCVL